MNDDSNAASSEQEVVKLLNPNQVAKVLDVTVGTLSVWRSTGRHGLPFLRLAGKIKYREKDIHEFINNSLIVHKSTIK